MRLDIRGLWPAAVLAAAAGLFVAAGRWVALVDRDRPEL